MIKFPTRVEWENEAVDVFVDDDDEALLMTAQDGVRLLLLLTLHTFKRFIHNVKLCMIDYSSIYAALIVII